MLISQSNSGCQLLKSKNVFTFNLALKTILHILIPLIVGVIIADTYPSIGNVPVLGFIALLFLVVLLFSVKRSFFSHSFIGTNSGFWMLIGILLYSLQTPASYASYYANYYNQNSELIVESTEVSATSNEKYIKVIGEVKAVINAEDTIATTGKILLYLEDSQQEVVSNQVFLFSSIVQPISNRNNPGEFDAIRYWKYQGIEYTAFVPEFRYVPLYVTTKNWRDYFTHTRAFLANRIDQFVSGQEGAVAKGLILGDRSSIESETTRMFGNTGVMHILAVSGMHVTVLVLLLNYVLRQFPRFISKKQAAFISLLVVWLYAFMTGFSVSVARAAWMFTFISGGTLLNRDYKAENGLLFSALVILLLSPYSLYDIGFQLSYTAMIGIYTFYPFLHKQVYLPNKKLQGVWDGIALSIAAQLTTTPIALYYFHQFPNYFLLTNIALGFYSIVILSLGVAIFLLGWWKIMGGLLGFVLFYVMFSMLWIIKTIDGIPNSVSEGFLLSGGMVLLLYVFLSLLFWSLRTMQYKPMLLASSVLIVLTGSIVLTRFSQMKQSQFIVFNHNGLVLALKSEKKLLVFYDAANVKEKQLQQLVASYQKIAPTHSKDTIVLSPHENISAHSSEHNLLITSQEGGYEIALNKEKFFVATHSRYKNETHKIILAPSMEDNEVFHQLNKGPFILNL